MAALAVSAIGGRAGSAQPTPTDSLGAQGAAPDPSFVPGELLVRFKPSLKAAARVGVLRDEGSTLEEELLLPGAVRVQLPAGESVIAAADAYERRSEVLYAEPNFIHEPSVLPNDTEFHRLWGLHQNSDADIDAPQAWEVTAGQSGVRVAVIDTGVDYDQPDLNPNMWQNDDPINGSDDDGNGFVDDTVGWDFFEDDLQPSEEFSASDEYHGTHVAGTIGARGDNDRGVTGVNWDVSLMALRAGNMDGLPTSAIVNATEYACDNGAQIVNGSYGADVMSAAQRDAILACPDTLFVFAAGNDGWDLDGSGPGSDSFPCELHRAPTNATNVLCVAATDRDDLLADFSQHGTDAVHLAAPGVGILSTWPGPLGNVYTELDGTSMASPHVAGVAALLLAQNSSRTVTDLKALLLSSVDPLASLSDKTITGGRLNACLALGRSAPECAAVIVKSWDGGAGTTSWHDGANWNPNQVPQPDDVVQIGSPFTVEYSGGSGEVKRIDVDGRLRLIGGELRLTEGVSTVAELEQSNAAVLGGAGDLEITGSFAWSGGVHDGTGTTHIAGATVDLTNTPLVAGPRTLRQSVGTTSGTGSLLIEGALEWAGGVMSGSGTTTIAPGATLTLNNTSAVTLDTRTLRNEGTATVTGGGGIHAGNGARLENTSDLTLASDADLLWNGVGALPELVNSGTLTKTDGSDVDESSVTFLLRNDGAVTSSTGRVALYGGDGAEGQAGSFGGIGPDAKVSFVGGEYDLDNGVVFTGSVEDRKSVV